MLIPQSKSRKQNKITIGDIVGIVALIVVLALSLIGLNEVIMGVLG